MHVLKCWQKKKKLCKKKLIYSGRVIDSGRRNIHTKTCKGVVGGPEEILLKRDGKLAPWLLFRHLKLTIKEIHAVRD